VQQEDPKAEYQNRQPGGRTSRTSEIDFKKPRKNSNIKYKGDDKESQTEENYFFPYTRWKHTKEADIYKKDYSAKSELGKKEILIEIRITIRFEIKQ